MIMQIPELLEDRNFAPVNLGRVLILGAGKSTLSTVEYLLELAFNRIEEIVIAAGPKNDSIVETLELLVAKSQGRLKVFFSREDVYDNDFGGPFNLCIVSPGISEFSDFVKDARKVSTEVISEVEFAFRESPKQIKWLAVTGTNGKTTTVSLITHILNSAGNKAISVGNIGNVCIRELKNYFKCQQECSKDSTHDSLFFVVEVSSFQLAFCKLFMPVVSAILNITPDHISWHKTFENYRDAKLKLFQNFSKSCHAVLDCTDPELRKCLSLLEYSKMFNLLKEENFINDEINFYFTKLHNWGRFSELKIKGDHNKHNALIAAIVCMHVGLTDEEIKVGLKSFVPLEHRLEKVDIVNDIIFINDSKATNVEASLQALTAYPTGKMILLFGGKDKGTDLSALAKKSHEVCKDVICYGAAALRFFSEFSEFFNENINESIYAAKTNSKLYKFFHSLNKIHFRKSSNEPRKHVSRLHQEKTFDKAFELACNLAEAGDYIVLSPACASFDEFSSFEERGKHFKKLVAALKKK